MRKRILFFALFLLLGSCAAFFILDRFVLNGEENPFTDVTDADWFSDSVRYVYNHGLMRGTDDETFSPNMTMQRGMIVTILYRLDGEPMVTEKCPFTDVPDGSNYEKPITWAASKGIANGFSDTEFGPYADITRQQMATFLYRYANLKRYDTSAAVNLDRFSDAGAMEDYARIPCAWASSKELINGTTDSTFSPTDGITRAQSAVIFDRFYENVIAPGRNAYAAALQRISSRNGVEAYLRDDGQVSAIDGQFTAQPVWTAADAANVLNAISPLFGESFHADASDFTSNVAADRTNAETFFRYSPSVNGIPVLGSQIVLSTDGEGTATGLFSAYDAAIQNVDTNPTLTRAEAEAIAVAACLRESETAAYLERLTAQGVSREDAEAAFRSQLTLDSALVVYAAERNETPTLAYAVSVDDTGEQTADMESLPASDADNEQNGTSVPSVSETYFIRANGDNSGTVLQSVSNVFNADWTDTVYVSNLTDENGNPIKVNAQEKEGAYLLLDAERGITTYLSTYLPPQYTSVQNTPGLGVYTPAQYVLPGTIIMFPMELSQSQSRRATMVHYHMEQVYDFYSGNLNRTSFDGKGADIKVSIDYNKISINAQWDSLHKQFEFGRGNFEACLDVIGHEFTHAVISHAIEGNFWKGSPLGGLAKKGESGALNEAYADIMGSLIEGEFEKKAKDDSERWTIGESRGSDSVLRNLAEPSERSEDIFPDGYPKHYNNRYQGETDKNHDYGGVHGNSCIFSHAAYLMMTDKDTKTVDDLEWARLFYHSMFRLTTTATFLDARNAVLATARTQGFTVEQLDAIRKAFDKVGITQDYAFAVNLTDLDGEDHIANASVSMRSLNLQKPGCKYSLEYQPDTEIFQTSLPNGRYLLTISADGYDEVREIVEVTRSMILHRPLTAKGVFTGTVKDQNTKEKLKGVTVDCILDERHHLSVTNDKGSFRVENLKSGSYAVTFTLDGYEQKIISADIESGHWSVTMDTVELIPLSQSTPNPVLAPDYYAYIRDVLVPRYGWANMDTKQKTISVSDYYAGSVSLYWDSRKGLVSAAVEDLNGDGVEDLLVLFFDADSDAQPYGQYQEALSLYAAVFSANAQGEIVHVGTQCVGNTTTAERYVCNVMLAGKSGAKALLVEQLAQGVFIDYGMPAYSVYTYNNNGTWDCCYKMEQSDGGTSGIAYSIFDRTNPSNPVKTILSADGEYRVDYPDAKIALSDSTSFNDVVGTGFSMMGLSASPVSDSDFYHEPSAWSDSRVTQLMRYRIGDEGSSSVRFTSILTDYTALQARFSGGEETPPPESGSVQAAAEAYQTLLRGYATTSESKFALVYIDDDDIPELLIFNGVAHFSYVRLYRYRQGEAVYEGIVGDYGRFGYQPKMNYFLFSHITNGVGDTGQYCSLAQSGWDVIHEVQWLYDEEGHYEVDGVRVTEETYWARIDEFNGDGLVVLRGNDTEEQGLYAFNERSYSTAFSAR